MSLRRPLRRRRSVAAAKRPAEGSGVVLSNTPPSIHTETGGEDWLELSLYVLHHAFPEVPKLLDEAKEAAEETRELCSYCRCAGYTVKEHPRVRLPESKLGQQMLELFGQLRIEDQKTRDWFARVLRERTRHDQKADGERTDDLNRQLNLIRRQQDQLLNLRLLEEIDQATFAAKSTELRDEAAKHTLLIDNQDRHRSEAGEIAIQAFELSQTLKDKWVTADYRAKRRILEIVCLNFTLNDASLCPVWRKPFDVLAETTLSEISRAERI